MSFQETALPVDDRTRPARPEGQPGPAWERGPPWASGMGRQVTGKSGLCPSAHLLSSGSGSPALTHLFTPLRCLTIDRLRHRERKAKRPICPGPHSHKGHKSRRLTLVFQGQCGTLIASPLETVCWASLPGLPLILCSFSKVLELLCASISLSVK